MEITVDSIREQIPYYLTNGQKDSLANELKNFSEKSQYYADQFNDELLQGDCWPKLQAIDFETGERDSILGIVLSNTCDITPENKRDIPPQIIFSPVLPLSQYVLLLEKSGMDRARIERKVDSIKKQLVNNIFYLPKTPTLPDECIVLLSTAYTMPASFFEREKKEKAFTLNQLGFYLFLLKLSVHFCRFSENVDRNGDAVVPS